MSFPPGLLDVARRHAESLMESTCTIREEPTRGDLNPATGLHEEIPGAVVYTGKCRVKPASTWGRETEAGEREAAPSTFAVSIPFDGVGAERVRRGHQLTIDTSPDPSLPGRRFELRFTPAAGDQITARRLLCEEMV